LFRFGKKLRFFFIKLSMKKRWVVLNNISVTSHKTARSWEEVWPKKKAVPAHGGGGRGEGKQEAVLLVVVGREVGRSAIF
jgi:hypothetical protein